MSPTPSARMPIGDPVAQLGGYLIGPYDADTCFDAEARALMIGAGDEPEAAAQSVAASRNRPDLQGLPAGQPGHQGVRRAETRPDS